MPGTEAFSTWPFRVPQPGTCLSDEEKETHRVLAALTTGERSYDKNWLFTDAIDTEESTVLMCATCRVELRHNRIPKFSKRNGFEMFDHYPSAITNLNELEIALLSIVIPTNRIFRRNGYQQKHILGQTITYWNSVMRVAGSIPRDAGDPSIVLMRNEHGRCLLDDMPLRFEVMLNGMRYLEQHNRHYTHIPTNKQSLRQLCTTSASFIVETGVAETDGSVHTDEWGSDDEAQEGAVEKHFKVQCVESDEEEYRTDMRRDGHETESETTPQNIFIIDSTDQKPLHQIATEAFLGKNYPMVGELGHDPQHGSGLDKRAFSTLYSNEGLYEMGFPHLFYRGTGGPSHTRQRPVSENELVSHLVKLHHRRFSQDASFLFFAHSAIQKRTVNGVVSSLEKSQNLKTLIKGLIESMDQSDTTRLEQSAALDKCIDSMTPQLTTVKGSPGYWRSKCTEVQAMVRSPLPRQPTLFMTLSAADSLWLDFLSQCLPNKKLDEVAGMTKTECSEILAANPDLAVEHFNIRWTALWDDIIMGEGRPLSNRVDYFWRIEFQQRGSPHVHMLLWVEGGPELSSLSDGVIPAQLREYVDRVVSAKLSPDVSDVDLSKVMHPCTMRAPVHELSCPIAQTHVAVLTRCVQTHRCNKYCKPKGRYSTCRFGYPRTNNENTSVERVFRNGKTKLVVSPARNDSHVNAYNPSILSCWGANMDVQVLLDAYGAAMYTASYLTKHEKNKHTPRILNQLSKSASNQSVKQMVRRIILSVLNTREVSMQEALWIRTGKQLCKSSRVVVTLPSLQCSIKKNAEQTRGHSVFVSTDGSVGHTNVLFLFYVQRPDSLNHLSLFECTTKYRLSQVVSESLKLKSPVRQYRYASRRRDDAIVFIRARIDHADVQSFSKAMLYLHVPWRSLDTIVPHGHDPSIVLTLAAERGDCLSLPAMMRHYESLSTQEVQLKNQQSTDREQAEHEKSTFHVDGFSGSDSSDEDEGDEKWDARVNDVDERDMDVRLDTDPTELPSLEQVTMPGPRISRTRHTQTPQARRAIELTNNILACKGRMESDEEQNGDGIEPSAPDPWALLRDRVDSLNSEQRKVYDTVHSDLIGGTTSKRVVLIGPGGTGKSYLIDTIGMMLDIRATDKADKDTSIFRPRHSTLVKSAYTGVAAGNIGGMTLHNALEIKGRNIECDIADASLTRLQRDWQDVAVLVIDEISFLSPQNLYEISARLGNIFPHKKHVPFAGLYVIMAGDPYQQ